MIKKLSLCLLFSTTLLVHHPFSAAAWAQGLNDRALSIIFTPPDDDQPKTSTGGGSRGNQCATDVEISSPYVVPVTPQKFAGLTTSARPSIFVYVGETNASKAFFSVKDQNNRHHYYTFVELPEAPGMLKIDLPANAPELRLNTDYSWFFALMCEGNLRPDSPTVMGHIKRVTPEAHNLSEQALAAEASLEQKASLYNQAGIWYEAVEILATLHQAQPENQSVSQAWENLLSTAGLGNISAPIISLE